MSHTAYTTVGKDGTIRMALHPMKSAPSLSYSKPKIRWPFRVVFLYDLYDDEWHYSCRGADVAPAEDAPGKEPGDCVYNRGRDADAIRWLLAGEK